MAETDIPLEVDCRAVKERLDDGEEFLLLDCREEDEYQLVHLAPATLIPMTQLAARVGELTPYRDRPIVVHCHHGGRSMRVVHWLRQQGFTRVQNMAGGIDAWAVDVDRSLPRY